LRIESVGEPRPSDLPGGQPALSVWQEPSTIALVGMGYVGLPTALALLEAGVSVVGYDISESRLAAIKSGQADLLERDRARLRDHMHHLTLTSEPRALADANVVVVCVPTPIDAHQVPDLLALRAACDTVVAHAVPGQTIILTSTTFVGCTREFVVEKLEARGLWVGVDVFVAFSPERIDPGNPAHVPEQPPRVIGGVSPECTRRAAKALRHTASRLPKSCVPRSLVNSAASGEDTSWGTNR
jgi:UDP-N-acetyl-D-glucosamine dehydrogenase